MRRTLLICTLVGTLAPVAACGGAKDASGDTGASARPTATQEAVAHKPVVGGHTVTLEVLGTGTVHGIYYNADTNGSAANATLPWKKTARVPGGTLVAVLASAPTGKKVSCRITVDGKVVAAKKNRSVAQCRYTLKRATPQA